MSLKIRKNALITVDFFLNLPEQTYPDLNIKTILGFALFRGCKILFMFALLCNLQTGIYVVFFFATLQSQAISSSSSSFDQTPCNMGPALRPHNSIENKL